MSRWIAAVLSAVAATIATSAVVFWGGASAEPGHAARQDPDNGYRIFDAMDCGRCHGGRGQGGMAPAIKGTTLSFDIVLAFLRNPPSFMREYPPEELSDEEVADLYAWLTSP